MQYIDKGFVQVIYYGLNYDLKRISNTFVFICSQYELQWTNSHLDIWHGWEIETNIKLVLGMQI